MLHRLICIAVLAIPTAAVAAGNVYAVMPTQGVGATAEALLVGQTMRLALQEQSLALVPAQAVESGVLAQTAACSQSVVACGRLVGEQTGATHAVVSELWDQAGTLELKVAIVDVRVDVAAEWSTWRTANAAELGPLSKRAVLNLVVPDALAGLLSVKQLEAGADIVVDGVARDRTPLLSPIKLPEGRHEVEIRLGTKSPWRDSVVIEAQRTTTLVVCVRGDVLTKDCAEDGGGFPLLTTVGGVVVVGGAVSGAVAVLSFLQAESAYQAFIDDPKDGSAIRTWQTIGATTGIGAGVLAVGGVAALTVGLMTE